MICFLAGQIVGVRALLQVRLRANNEKINFIVDAGKLEKFHLNTSLQSASLTDQASGVSSSLTAMACVDRSSVRLTVRYRGFLRD